MLSNSPGGVNFESAPFKLTRELLEVNVSLHCLFLLVFWALSLLISFSDNTVTGHGFGCWRNSQWIFWLLQGCLLYCADLLARVWSCLTCKANWHVQTRGRFCVYKVSWHAENMRSVSFYLLKWCRSVLILSKEVQYMNTGLPLFFLTVILSQILD